MKFVKSHTCELMKWSISILCFSIWVIRNCEKGIDSVMLLFIKFWFMNFWLKLCCCCCCWVAKQNWLNPQAFSIELPNEKPRLSVYNCAWIAIWTKQEKRRKMVGLRRSVYLCFYWKKQKTWKRGSEGILSLSLWKKLAFKEYVHMHILWLHSLQLPHRIKHLSFCFYQN